ncbi:hypothetical protein CSU32_01660 [Salmonella enterica subsp. diarizonae]|uniref:Cytoplasmic protein n=1 Tax=Salmonella diarizonae TaxID=59204 RepID=A0A6Y1UIS1_SALDZ|nr:hypothetical protein [Salmonella enterica subsp. diarizonae]ECI3358519.1 hypothetical protein [Salmonella enterica subsp. diarizonae]EFV1874714.1 hypothetical protein [Salmonella enterica]HAB4052121.1 hypothetical protein [Salmonella enterica subsp. diarizonae]
MFHDKEYQILVRLYACPGEFIHGQYWALYELSHWLDDYQMFPALRPSIDHLLHHHLGWKWHTQAAEMSPCQRQWITWIPKLPVMLTALGLISLNSIDYFLLGDYRRVLIHLLGEVTVNQLFSLWHGENAAPTVAAHELPAVSFSLGLQIFSQIVGDDWIGNIIMHTLPPIEYSDVEQLRQNELDDINSMLARIGRFI